ncbi:hypothetical protein HPB48_022638 [Haemaphysalis longicornis]|uniref:Uncharacterized protein n=1 Tax=Haemaphysalis longicornis TaxID=44386 RepID=A0A9J6G9U8_HAELO|nr:hypothetical protein HPB48_022638 [Haemaphysalis longicornis]
MSHKMAGVKRCCTPHTHGGDYFIVQTTVQTSATLARKLRQQYITEWHAFKDTCRTQDPPGDNFHVQEWINRLVNFKTQHDQPLDPNIPADYRRLDPFAPLRLEPSTPICNICGRLILAFNNDGDGRNTTRSFDLNLLT